MEGISKAVVADLFGVSRSAVSQSMKNKTPEQDILIRIMKYITPKDTDGTLEDGSYIDIVHNKAGRLLKKCNLLCARRSTDHKVGRPTANLDVEAFMKLVERVVFMITDALSDEINKVKNKALFILKFIYSGCNYVRKGWNHYVMDIEDTEEDYEDDDFESGTTDTLVNSDTDKPYWSDWNLAQKMALVEPGDYFNDMIIKDYNDGMLDEHSVAWSAFMPKVNPTI